MAALLSQPTIIVDRGTWWTLGHVSQLHSMHSATADFGDEFQIMLSHTPEVSMANGEKSTPETMPKYFRGYSITIIIIIIIIINAGG